jgi:hypothetical protein
MHQGASLAETGFSSFQILVGNGYLFFQCIEFGIPEHLPPFSAQILVAWLRGFPHIRFLEGLWRRFLVCRRRRNRRPNVLGTHGATQHEHSTEQYGKWDCDSHCCVPPSDGLLTRTGVPEIRESAGSRITISEDCNPETISTVLPLQKEAPFSAPSKLLILYGAEQDRS